MSRRVVLLVLAGLILVGLWVGIMFMPHDPGYVPHFLAGAQDAPGPHERLRNAPFVKKLGPRSSENLGTAGVTYHDYLLAGSYDDAYKRAKEELHGGGWEAFFTFSKMMEPGRFMPASGADALFMRGDDAVTVFRDPVQGKTRVRVWHRGPSLFGL